MKITKLENNNELKIELNSGGKLYLLSGSYHRGGGLPAVITAHSEEYIYRGVKISKEIALGKLPPQDILNIKNMEIKQRAMEILGYEQFLKIFTQIDSFTPGCFAGRYAPDEMYTLYQHKEPKLKEPTKILRMYDPSKVPFIRYFIRVAPSETRCTEAVAHSYKLQSWDDFMFCKNWV